MTNRIALACAIAFSCSGICAASPLLVIASEVHPCVFTSDGDPSGFSVELWETLASTLEIEYSLELKSFDEKLVSIKEKRADVAIGCISVTNAREQDMDFTHPIAASGFTAVSLVDRSLIPNFSDESMKMLLILLLLVILFAHLMWISEHGRETISDRYLPGVFESMWFSIVTMSTVGYGDIAPKRALGRVSAVLLILTGVTAFGVIFGQFAADAMVQRATSPVQSVSDLRKYVVGIKTNTAAAAYCEDLGLKTETFDDLQDAAEALREGHVDIVVHDAFAISHLAKNHQDLIVTEPSFAPHFIAIALQEASTLREPLNAALLKIQADGRYRTIQDRWF